MGVINQEKRDTRSLDHSSHREHRGVASMSLLKGSGKTCYLVVSQ